MRLIAIMGGGDWADASVDFLHVKVGVDLEKEKDKWREWYYEEYVPQLRAGEGPKYIRFCDWLVKGGLAQYPKEDDIEEFWDN